MKKKLLAFAMSAVLTMGIAAGCGAGTENGAVEPQNTQTQQEEQVKTPATENAAEDTANQAENDTVIRIGGLKGPTSMGLAELVNAANAGESNVNVDFTMAAAADELTPALIQGELDMLAVPSNLASVLYNKTEGKVEVLAVNTLGVLYIVDKGDSVNSIADLKGKTILATGEGATPEYSLKYLLKENGLDPENDVTFEWKSEPTEIVSAMTSSDEEVIAMLPQPFVTVAQTQVEGLNVVVDLNEQWNALDNGSALVTGVLVARKDFVEANKEVVDAFLDSYKASIEFANSNVEEVAPMVEALDIVKAPIAQKALPKCNLTYMEGDEMKAAVGGYLQVLFEQNPKSIGGTLPADDFYYAR